MCSTDPYPQCAEIDSKYAALQKIDIMASILKNQRRMKHFIHIYSCKYLALWAVIALLQFAILLHHPMTCTIPWSSLHLIMKQLRSSDSFMINDAGLTSFCNIKVFFLEYCSRHSLHFCDSLFVCDI